ncbi:S9 family peptidase [Erysipelotrichaceae bacterium Oil+RF-744-GAM-WT-6]|uniref:S9 family peptidase n=1 Tax=Stecheria intestinalis TaxID=2606630 RepID=A0A7X2NTT3_9FIRM|nr:S9 family peptidase [Stecheria intestinalis]MSS59394.1 S9 family peptidase [Stecheria intestinalis]
MKSAVSDYYRIRYAGNGDLSPDGTVLIYTRTHTVPPAEEVHELVRKDLKTNKESILGYGMDPHFSADGSCLYYTGTVSGTCQLFCLDLSSGKSSQLTRMRYGICSPVFSRDGLMAAFTSIAETGSDEASLSHPVSAEEQEQEARNAAEHPYVSITEVGYKSDEYGGFSAGHFHSLWVLNLKTGVLKMISEGERDHVMPVFSIDSRKLFFVSNRERKKEESIAMDLYEADLKNGVLSRLTHENWVAWYPAPFQPVITEDGASILYGALAPSLAGGMPLTRLWRYDFSTKKSVSLWDDHAPCHEATAFLYNAENPGVNSRETAVLSADGKHLYFLSGWHGAVNLYDASIEKAEIRQVSHEKACYRSIHRVGTHYLLSRTDFTDVPQLYLAEEGMMNRTAQWKPKKLTDENPWMKEVLVSPEEMTVSSLDGEAEIQGWVFHPQEYDPEKKYPAIVYIHGGPAPMMGYALTYEHQAILGAGMGLILLNFRGSSGYGEAFESMKAAYDGRAMTDILQFVSEACRKNSWIDEKRLGVTGGSYGGWMTNWITSHSKVFKAAVTQRSIANELIQYASSDMSGSSEDYRNFEDFMKDELKNSPISYAENIDIPFLILHGMNDMRCPAEQAHQLFSAVKETHPDQPVKMILYPGMTHSFPMSGPMNLRIHHYQAMIDWFSKYL